MKLVLSTGHKVTGDCEEDQLVDERFLQINLDMLVRKYSLTFDKQRTDLRFSDNIPPIFTVLNDVLDHLIVVTFEFVVFLITKQP